MEGAVTRPSKPKQEANKYNPNFWGMMQNVLIASLNKGQFLIGILGFIIIIMVLKMPGKDVSKLMFGIVNIFKHYYLLGWVLALLTTITSVFLVNWVRKLHDKSSGRLENRNNRVD